MFASDPSPPRYCESWPLHPSRRDAWGSNTVKAIANSSFHQHSPPTAPIHICTGRFFSVLARRSKSSELPSALLWGSTNIIFKELCMHLVSALACAPGLRRASIQFFWWFFKNLTLCFMKALTSLPGQSRNSLHNCFSTLNSIYKRTFNEFTQLNNGLS